ncbi:MAG: energy transducer TonB [Candidatus Sulfotelmatobacter sp.]
MRQPPGSLQEAQTEPSAPELTLLIASEPRSRVFLQNLRDLFRQPESTPLRPESAPAAFWTDVFVDRGLPWRRFGQSSAYHVLALVLIWAGSRFLALQPHAASQPAFTHTDVVYYTPSEYLPPLDTRRSASTRARKADPEYSAQPIISVPPEADNRSQTIVTPPSIKLQRDVAMPNVVSLLEKMPGNPQMPIRPAPVVPASEISRLAPRMERAVIAPPPAVETSSARRLGDLNIGHSSVIAPAPQLSLDEQRAAAGGRGTAMSKHSLQVIAPPPSLAATGRSHSGQGMLALNLHPAVGAPPDPPAGNRRGNFAATPEGHRGASGAPATSVGNGKADGSGSAKNSGNLPSGLYVGNAAAKSSSAYSVNPRLLASARSPRMDTAQTLQPANASKLSDVERAVFGDRKYYSLSLNMPNLNSAGGSWIIRFAPLQKNSIPGSPSSRAAAGDPRADGSSQADLSAADLSAPVATRKVDPAYPLELMHQNVGGTVILYGVIHTDGTVGSVRVLRGVDDRLAQFASQAIAKWQFQPATKNGAPVDVEATFWIPFHPVKANPNF